MFRTGNCRCGHLQYRVVAELGPVVNCHCAFCRRIHGAAFTTVALLEASAFAWLPTSGESSRFTTPAGNVRHFCGRCGSPTCAFAPGLDLASLVVGSLAEEHQPSPWAHVNIESKSPWFRITDDLPQFEAWPAPAELRNLARQHPSAWLPEQLLGPVAQV